ncbi:DUF1993 domain-containing protein [Hyphococcus sp.]|uniref:DUF1993 domain-containing protein n=1 Tax=Hyphococcus sp. TaxID=2038636 RepID=UPI003CCBDB3F
MTISISTAVIPAVNNMFETLEHLIDKASAHCKESAVEESVYLGWRLAPDMLPLMTQFRFATEIPARGLSRLAGAEIPVFEDNEASFTDLRARIARARSIIADLEALAIDDHPQADITVPMGPERTITMKRGAFVHEWIMPNLYFHVTTAYLILRHLGIEIGKRDYLVGLARHFKV